MSVWKNPKLIVDTLVLSQVYAAGCEIKRKDGLTYTIEIRNNGGKVKDTYYFNFDQLDSQIDNASYNTNDDVITQEELNRFASHDGWNTASGPTGVLYNS